MNSKFNMKKKRKICYITGTRADYGLMRNALKEIDKVFDLSLIVVGTHLLSEFGDTAEEIKKDGFKIAKKINTMSSSDTVGGMSKAFGLGVIKITDALENIKPDILLLLGDRGEALAGAISGAHLNIPIIHIHGGDQGDDGAHIDDPIRHSITKFAHIHLPATKLSAKRIIKMGEEEWRVNVVGSPALDDISSQDFYSKKYLEKKYNINFKKPLILTLQHPSSTQAGYAKIQMKETLDALKEVGENTILIYPNSDAGGRSMIKVIKGYENYNFLHTYKSLPRKDYLSLMKYASVMVGNSSSGTIDAPSFKLPVVNIGTRELVREHAGNKIFVSHKKNEIKKAIKKALFDKKFIERVQKCKSSYGDGYAGKRIVKILKNLKINNRLLEKHLTY